MELNKNIYIGFLLVGLVFSILSFAQFGMDSALTILFFTITFILIIKLFVEYRYYRSYKAPLASGIFLLIPSIIALSASYISRNPFINGEPFFSEILINVNLRLVIFSPNPLILYANYFSLLFALPFYVILLLLLNRYYTGQYPRLFLMRKKFYKQFAMYFNLILIGILAFEWLSLNTIEIFELIFVIISVIFVIRTYVFKIVLVPVRVVPTRPRRQAQRRSYTGTTNTPTNRTVQNPRPTPTSTAPRAMNHSPQRNPRLTAVQTRPVSQPRSVTHTPTRTTPTPGHVQVAEGIPVNQTTQSNKSKINHNNVRDLIPSVTHLSEDDFRCIFCYEMPIKTSDQVIICPNCKKPAHLPEYQQWSSMSNICSYCNQDIGSRVPKRINGKTYKQIISVALRR